MINEENILIQAGLSSEQSTVYQALLDKGPQKAGDLSKWTGIKRGLMYKVLEQLENMGMIIKNENKGSVAVFSPSHPSLLLSNLERKEREVSMTKEILKNSIGTLSSKFNLITGKPNVQFFEGKDGIEKILDDTLGEKDEVLTYADIEIVEKYFKDVNSRYVEKREKLGMKKRVLVIENEFSINYFSKLKENNPEYFSVTNIKTVKTPVAEVEGAIQIYGNKIGIISISNENLIGVIIEDARINKLFKSMFEAIYSSSLPFNP